MVPFTKEEKENILLKLESINIDPSISNKGTLRNLVDEHLCKRVFEEVNEETKKHQITFFELEMEINTIINIKDLETIVNINDLDALVEKFNRSTKEK